MTVTVDGRPVERLLVVGYGMTGRAVAQFCVRRGVSFSLTDAGRLAPADEAWLVEHARAVETGGHTLGLLGDVDAVIATPGAPAELGLFAEARRRGIPIWSELDLASTVSGERRLIAVTGTNGKSTTVSLIGALLARAGVSNVVAGNIGLPFLDVADAALWDVAVLEVSSFQLEQSALFHPSVGALLNLTPNHLERHGSMAAYTAAKLRLFARQDAADAAALPSDLAGRVDHGKGRLLVFDDPMPPLPLGSAEVGEVRRLNLAAAVTVCREIAPEFDATQCAVGDLRDALYLPHRQEEVGSIGGVRLVNDSKATSPAATVAALRSAREPTVLLLGGRSKRGGYDELARFLAASPPRAVVVYGEARDEIASHLAAERVGHVVVGGFEAAVAAGLAAARPGDILLLSPACSSFDQFKNYEERGDAFRRLAQASPGFRPPAVADT